VAHGREELPRFAVAASAATQDLPIDGQVGQHRHLLLQEPGADHRFEVRRVELGEHAEEGGIARGGASALLVRLAAQGLELALGELPASVLEGLIPAGPHQRGGGRPRQHEGLAVAQAVARTPIAQGAEALPERAQFAGAEGTGAGEVLFGFGQAGRQPAATQRGAGAGAQFAQVELLGLAVFLVEVTAGAPVALGEANGLEPAGPVAGAAIAALIDKALHHQHRMAPPGLPIVAEPAQTDAEHARGQIGIALTLGQDQEPAVVDHEEQSAGARAWGPANPLLAALQMEGSRTEADERDPLTVEFGHVAEGLTRQAGAGQVVLMFQAVVELVAFLVADQPDRHWFQNVGFTGRRWLRQGHEVKRAAAEVQSFLTPPLPCRYSARPDETTLVVDGTGLTLADTRANQKKDPQSQSQKPGCGFPLLKLVVFMSLASGALLAVAKGNKHQSELGLFRRLWDGLCAGDLVLGDDTYSDYATLAGLRARQADGVFRRQGRRGKDFRRGQPLGRYDRRGTRHKPSPPPRTVSPRVWAQLPEAIQVRLIRFPVAVPGFRTRHIDLVTTLLDPRKYPAAELPALFRRRWRLLELCLRDLQTTLGMEQLRCKSPERVHKELLMYLIAHNLIRYVMAEAAGAYAVELERISFKGALDTVRHYSTALAQARNEKQQQFSF